MKRVLFVIVIAIGLSSCEKLLFEPDLASNDPLENFDYLWNELDKKYSYFELKSLNWIEIKNTYRSQLTENSTEEELFSVMAAMMNELRDDHSNLISPFNISVYNVALRGPENYHPRTIEEFYLTDKWITGSLQHGFLENNEIGYIRYGSFEDGLSEDQLDFVITRYKDTKGLILDLRANGGGNIDNITVLLERFVPTQLLVGYSVTRNGPNHGDFSEKQNFTVKPFDGVRYTKPIMVLTDRGSYSATTFFAVATKAIPNITLVGDTTGGGGGLPNGGMLPNGWNYRFSVSQTLDVNGNNYAELGVPPDILVYFDWTDLTKDEVLERAILELQ